MKDVVPLCMSQYHRMFGTTRIPGVEEGWCLLTIFQDVVSMLCTDYLQHVANSRHVAGLYEGYFYVFDLVNSNGHRLTALECERQLKAIVKDRASAPEPGVSGLYLQ